MRDLKGLVLKNGLLAAGFCATLVLGFGWLLGVLHPLVQARSRLDRDLERVARVVNAGFDGAEKTGHGLRGPEPVSPLEPGLPARMTALQPFLDPAGMIMNILMARVEGETLFLVNAAPGWNMVLIPAGAEHATVWRQRGGVWSESPAVAFEQHYQAQDRPWFQLAEQRRRPGWTAPYRFTARDAGWSYVVPVDQGGRFQGVVGVDISLALLEQRLREALPQGGCRLLVTGAGEQVLLASEPGRAAVEPLSRANPELLARFQRRDWLGYQRQIQLRHPEPALTLRVQASPGHLLPGLRLRIAILILAAVITFAAVMVYAGYLERRLVRPIQRLLLAAEPGAGRSDIREFRQLETAIRSLGQSEADRQQILRQLEHSQRLETMGSMAPGIIHDLNNHLAVVMAQLNLCLEEVDGMASASVRLDRAGQATQRCSQSLRGLLDFCRPGDELTMPVDLNELVRDTCALLEPVLGLGVRIETDLAEALPALSGQAVKLQQVLVNLALNGRDAMTGAGLLTFRTSRDAVGLRLEVQDSGAGLSPEARHKLFTPFFTTKPVGKGTGLGLTMVQRIITGHQGTIQVESEPGLGTRFIIRLPESPWAPVPE